LASLPPDLVEFLMETSVLEAFDAELCAEVTGADDAATLLEGLLAANLFLVEMDHPPRWFRYHHLFGAFLRARLASHGGARLRAVHDRASRAVEVRGLVDVALRHAMATGDVDRVDQILRHALARSMSVSGGADEVVQALRLWLHDLGPAAIENDPASLVEFLIGLISVSRPDDIPPWLERVRRAHPNADGQLTALIEGAWSQHHDHRGQPLEAIGRLGLALDAVGGTPPSVGLLALLHTAKARAHLHAGQTAEARSVLQQARSHPVGHPVADDVRSPALAALVAAYDGELTAAAELVRSAGESADLLDLERHEMGRIYAGLAMVEISLERNERENARDLVDELRAAAAVGRFATIQNDVMLQQAKVARFVGDEAGAEALLTEARLSYTDPDAAMRQVFDEEAVAQALRFDPARATSLIVELDPDRVATRVLTVRLALLRHDHGEAARLLADIPAPSTRRARVERAVLCALSVLDRDVDGANRHLEAALVEAQPVWLIRTIIDLGTDVHKLLLSFAPNVAQKGYVDALLAAASRDVAPVRVRARAAGTLADPLSAREATVLRYLCSRLTYQEIAAALYVSLNTLKSHVRTIYRKLAVSSRGDAVDAGRRLGLI
jgi:LuxR family maltose regulon positive regulatory protein